MQFGKCIPFWSQIPGCSFRLGPRWESASRSKVELWDALSDRQPSLGKQKAPARTEAGAKGTAYAVEVERVRPVNKDRPRSTLPAVTGAAVRGIHHGQIRAQLAVKRTVGILHGRCRGDRCDLADALAAICHRQ